MNAPKKKLLVLSLIAPRQLASYERYHFGVARELKARGWEVLSAFSGPITDPVREAFGLDPSDYVVELGDARPGASEDAWIDLVRREQPTVVWLHFFTAWGSLARRIRRTLPRSWVVLTDHVSRGRVRRGWVKGLAHRVRGVLIRDWVDVHIAVSHFIADRLVHSDHVAAAKVRVITNGVDVTLFQVAPVAPEDGYFITICYLRPEKGVGVLLEALARLKRAGVEPRCLVVGDGPKLDEYRAFVRDTGLARVEVLGHRNDVPALLHEAMVSVVPSVWPEAFSFAAAEAQAAGVPVIASAIGGLKEVVADGVTGLLVPPNDPDALAAAIRRLVNERDRRIAMRSAGRERAERLFDLTAKVRETVELFEAIVTRDRRDGPPP